MTARLLFPANRERDHRQEHTSAKDLATTVDSIVRAPLTSPDGWIRRVAPLFRFVECQRGRRRRRRCRGTPRPCALSHHLPVVASPPPHAIKPQPPTQRSAHTLAPVSVDKSFLTYNCIDLILRLPAVMSCPCRGRRALARPELRPPALGVPPPCDRCCAWQQAAGCAGGGWLVCGRGLGRHVSGRVLHIRKDS